MSSAPNYFQPIMWFLFSDKTFFIKVRFSCTCNASVVCKPSSACRCFALSEWKKKKKAKLKANLLSQVFHQHDSTTDVRHRKQTVLTAWVTMAPIASTPSSRTSMQTVQVLCAHPSQVTLFGRRHAAELREIGGVTLARAAQLAPTRGVLTFRQGQRDSHCTSNQSIETELTKKKKEWRKKKNEIWRTFV